MVTKADTLYLQCVKRGECVLDANIDKDIYKISKMHYIKLCNAKHQTNIHWWLKINLLLILSQRHINLSKSFIGLVFRVITP